MPWKIILQDLILIMAVFLVAGGLIYEEKEKKLFYITRATAGGRGKSIGAKIFTSLICSIIIAVLHVGENIIFYGLTVGFGDVTLKYPVSIWIYGKLS